jgi:hypothetical protein
VAAPGEATLCVGQAILITAPFVGAGRTNPPFIGWFQYESILFLYGPCTTPLSAVLAQGIPIITNSRYTFRFNDPPPR